MTAVLPAPQTAPASAVRLTDDTLAGSGWSRVGRVLILIVSDALAVSGAGMVAFFLWARPVLAQPASLYLNLFPLVALFPLGYAVSGLYPGFALGAVESLRRLSRTTSLILVTIAALVFILKLQDYYSRVTFGLFWAGTLVLVPVTRFLLLSIVREWSWWQEPCIVVGTQERVKSTIDLLAGALTVGYRPVATVTVETRREDGGLSKVPEGLGIDCSEVVAERDVRTVIVDVDARTDHVLLRALQACFRHVICLRSFADVELAEPRDLGGVFGLEFRNELLRRRSRVIKRSLDLVVGSISLIIALPLIVAGVAVVRLASPGPGLFRQIRLGRNGRAFALWKIRTMVAQADLRLKEALAADPRLRVEWEDGFKLRNDHRVLPVVGTFLRRLCIDELPQLWNVLKGDMSLVGPRPLPRYHWRGFDQAQRELRQRVRPGMTGLWQVRSEGSGNTQT